MNTLSCSIGNVGQKVSCKLPFGSSSKDGDGGNSETSATQTISVRCHFMNMTASNNKMSTVLDTYIPTSNKDCNRI